MIHQMQVQIFLDSTKNSAITLDHKWLARQMADLDYHGLVAFMDELEKALLEDARADKERGRTMLSYALAGACEGVASAAFSLRRAARICTLNKEKP